MWHDLWSWLYSNMDYVESSKEMLWDTAFEMFQSKQGMPWLMTVNLVRYLNQEHLKFRFQRQ